MNKKSSRKVIDDKIHFETATFIIDGQPVVILVPNNSNIKKDAEHKFNLPDPKSK